MTKKYLPIILLLGSFLLFACSSPNDSSNNNVQSMETQQEQLQPTLTATLSQEDPATKEPQKTPTNEAMTETPNDQQIDSESLCYHPYFPVIEGASWTYDDDLDEDYTIRITETRENSFTMTQQLLNDENFLFTADWYCSEEGILRGSFAQVDLINQAGGDAESPEFEFETLEWEGETLPNPDLLEVGYAWTSTYKLSANYDIEGFSDTFEVNVTIDHEIASIEEVTVPAGAFSEAIRVDSTGQIDMGSLFGENNTFFSSFDFGYSTWYVEGVGMVRSSSEISGFNSGVSLTDSSLLN